MKSAQPIGIFDSGIGGLTVLKELRQHFPHENFVYLGDTARVPYGTKSRETVMQYSMQNARFLTQHAIKALVVACNTASAYGLDELQNHFDFPIVGVVDPGAKAAVKVSASQHIGVMGTAATIRSEAYQKSLTKLNPEARVMGQACPLLVSLAEEGWVTGDVPERILQKYLNNFRQDSQIDTVILGCTHYPLLKKTIAKVLGDQVSLVDSAIETALALKEVLAQHQLLNDTSSSSSIKIYCTDSSESMRQMGKSFLGQDLKSVEHVDL